MPLKLPQINQRVKERKKVNLLVAQEQLTPRTADELISKFGGGMHLTSDPVAQLDMDKVEFIAPYGLVVLCLLGRYAKTIWPRVVFRLPASYALRSYLGRVRFAEALQGIVELEGPDLVVDEGREKTDSEALLEITRIEERVDVENVLGYIGQRVEAILAEELHYAEKEINQFKNVVAELCHNILDHSMNWGYVTAQRYLDARSGKKYVVIGVGDLGIGIKKSLAHRFDVGQWSHGTAIVNSLRKHVSRDEARGLGLYIVNSICHQYNGSLHLRSGDTRVYIRRGRQAQYLASYFPGTMLSIVLYQRS
jgi:hypothetical protein